MEDDDWYSEIHVRKAVEMLAHAPLVTHSSHVANYNVRDRRYRLHRPDAKRAGGLNATAFRVKEILPVLRAVLPHSPIGDVDINLGRAWKGEHIIWKRGYGDDSLPPLVVPIKALSGRAGLTSGHAASTTGGELYTDDLELKQLAAWIGEKNARLYAPFYQPATTQGEATEERRAALRIYGNRFLAIAEESKPELAQFRVPVHDTPTGVAFGWEFPAWRCQARVDLDEIGAPRLDMRRAEDGDEDAMKRLLDGEWWQAVASATLGGVKPRAACRQSSSD